MTEAYRVLQDLKRDGAGRLRHIAPTRRVTGPPHRPFLTPGILKAQAVEEQIEAAVDQGWNSEQWPEEIPVENEKENTDVNSAT